MNQTQKIRNAEHTLSQIEGHTIVATRKKCEIYSRQTVGVSYHLDGYSKPTSYKNFVEELLQACHEGDNDSRKAIDLLAPDMAETLKKIEEWVYIFS